MADWNDWEAALKLNESAADPYGMYMVDGLFKFSSMGFRPHEDDRDLPPWYKDEKRGRQWCAKTFPGFTRKYGDPMSRQDYVTRHMREWQGLSHKTAPESPQYELLFGLLWTMQTVSARPRSCQAERHMLTSASAHVQHFPGGRRARAVQDSSVGHRPVVVSRLSDRLEVNTWKHFQDRNWGQLTANLIVAKLGGYNPVHEPEPYTSAASLSHRARCAWQCTASDPTRR